MDKNKAKSKPKRRRGRPPKHGGYSLVARDEMLKEHPHLKRYLEDCRAGLVRDVAGTEDQLTEGQRLIIDRLIPKLAICRLIEIYIEKYGIFRRDQLQRRKVLELEPALGTSYLAFDNSIRLGLALLGIDKRKADDVIDLGRYVAEKYGNGGQAASETCKSANKAKNGEASRKGEGEEGKDE